jgi:hypothetical protein
LSRPSNLLRPCEFCRDVLPWLRLRELQLQPDPLPAYQPRDSSRRLPVLRLLGPRLRPQHRLPHQHSQPGPLLRSPTPHRNLRTGEQDPAYPLGPPQRKGLLLVPPRDRPHSSTNCQAGRPSCSPTRNSAGSKPHTSTDCPASRAASRETCNPASTCTHGKACSTASVHGETCTPTGCKACCARRNQAAARQEERQGQEKGR